MFDIHASGWYRSGVTALSNVLCELRDVFSTSKPDSGSFSIIPFTISIPSDSARHGANPTVLAVPGRSSQPWAASSANSQMFYPRSKLTSARARSSRSRSPSPRTAPAAAAGTSRTPTDYGFGRRTPTTRTSIPPSTHRSPLTPTPRLLSRSASTARRHDAQVSASLTTTTSSQCLAAARRVMTSSLGPHYSSTNTSITATRCRA